MDRASDEERTHTVPGSEDEPSEERCLLVFWAGGAATYELPAHGAITIGRGADCDIRIDHPSVSRLHAKLEVDDQLWVEDLGSANGTRLGGRRLAAHEREVLQRGALLEVGLATAVVQRQSVLPRQLAARPVPADENANRPTMERVFKLADLVAPSPLSVILLGETGVGKEVLAERIHRHSPRAARPLVSIHCAALPEPLLESELFGHERGAFTGAVKRKTGLLESADGGTIFLDEVGEIPLSIQAKLLRVIESRQVTPVGSVTSHAIDVRFIAATNRELEELVVSGGFRRDLYFRLNGISIRIPPLRDRRGEIPALAQLFASEAARASGRPDATITPAAMELLDGWSWPGNVRELRNVVERACVLSNGAPISPAHLQLSAPPAVATRSNPPATATDAIDLRGEVEALERQRIIEALDRCGGNQTAAAKLLGISRRTLLGRLDVHGLPRPRKR